VSQPPPLCGCRVWESFNQLAAGGLFSMVSSAGRKFPVFLGWKQFPVMICQKKECSEAWSLPFSSGN
jgi:hypothetical protein